MTEEVTMAAITTPANSVTPSRLATAARACARVVTSGAQLLARPHKAAVTNLFHMPLTAAGTGCIDYAAFHLGAGWGWLVTGVSLVLVETIIADER